jgi:hypothetical protein
MHVRTILLVPLAVALSIGPSSNPVEAVGREQPKWPTDTAPFRLANGARSSLQQLWQSSSIAREERVACIGGFRDAGVTYITRVEQVIAAWGDSSHLTAEGSLQQCRPPEWLGTVHTHIVQIAGRPYVTFSGADRAVMWEWHNRWHTDGVFCVLYDYRRAYCEAGTDLSGEVVYANPLGNNLAR